MEENDKTKREEVEVLEEVWPPTEVDEAATAVSEALAEDDTLHTDVPDDTDDTLGVADLFYTDDTDEEVAEPAEEEIDLPDFELFQEEAEVKETGAAVRKTKEELLHDARQRFYKMSADAEKEAKERKEKKEEEERRKQEKAEKKRKPEPKKTLDDVKKLRF